MTEAVAELRDVVQYTQNIGKWHWVMKSNLLLTLVPHICSV